MLYNTASNLPKQIIFANEVAEVWKDDSSGHHSLHALASFRPGDVFFEFGASAILQTPSYLTIQIGVNEHICLQPVFLQYINHSCSPNVFFDTSEGKVICLQAIKPGDELGYFYPSTEWDMAQPFQCICDQKNCLGYIRGAAYLSKEVLSGYRLSDFIRQQLNKKYIK
jgi:hypothetical protein